MRVPDQVVVARSHLLRRYQVAILAVVVALILLAVVVQLVADGYTNYLWYRSIGETMVWRSMAETKLGLVGVFCGAFFVACWASLWAVDNLSVLDVYAAEEHVVRRYRASFGRYRGVVRTLIALALALAVGIGTNSQWQHWLLFQNGGSFGLKDPEFGRDVGFYVFRLPFLSFLVDWALVALVVLFVVTAVAHYLNGGLRLGGSSPRIEGYVISHLSLILALMALVRAAGYFFVDRFALDLSSNGVVAGADYTDVAVRLPALAVLAVASMLAFALLSFNIYQRSLAVPLVAVGLWAFLAFILGVVFPWAVQTLKVDPSPTVELPYVERNIQYTQDAYGIGPGSITPETFTASHTMSPAVLNANRQSLADLSLWSPTAAAKTFTSQEAVRGYYRISSLAEDRYRLGFGPERALTPVIIATRTLDLRKLRQESWATTHLDYTHGYGLVLSPANTSSSSGQPTFPVGGDPLVSQPGDPDVDRPDLYFGSGAGSYVVVDTKAKEVDSAGPYSGGGGVRLSGFWQRFAYAAKFHDLNLLFSNLITPRSRIIYRQAIDARVKAAAPFLSVDAHPYPVVADGQVFFMVDCYVTSAYFPYSEPAPSQLLPVSSGLGGQYDYVRDAVKAVVNAYTGQVSLFAVDAHNPVLAAWERAYPGLVQPFSAMAKLTPSHRGALFAHLRYPQDLLTMLSSVYGRYHFLPRNKTQAAQFLEQQDEYQVAASSDGRTYTPAYELVRLPTEHEASFVALEPLVPASATGKDQLLAGFVTAECDYRSYGSLRAYLLPSADSSTEGPKPVGVLVNDTPKVEKATTLDDGRDSRLVPGEVLLVPIEDSVLYVQPYYRVDSGGLSSLAYVATEFGKDSVSFANTLVGSLRLQFGDGVTGFDHPATTVPARVSRDLALAYAAYERSVVDLEHDRLGAFQADLREVGRYLAAAHRLMSHRPSHTVRSSKAKA